MNTQCIGKDAYHEYEPLVAQYFGSTPGLVFQLRVTKQPSSDHAEVSEYLKKYSRN